MSLLFGTLSNQFVEFGKAVIAYNDDPTNPEVLDFYHKAQHDLRHGASMNSLYLVFIGIAMFVVTYAYMLIWVRRVTFLSLILHDRPIGCLGMDRSNQLAKN